MANHKSAAKRARQSLVKGARKSGTKSAIRTCEKKLRKAIEAKSGDQAKKLLVTFTKSIDKAAQKGILHANNASRKVSRLASQVSSLTK